MEDLPQQQRFHYYLSIALKKAFDNVSQRHRIGALVVKGGRILACECNYRTKHAEHRALQKIWNSELVGAIIFVARPRYDQQVGLARPCDKCLLLLQQKGIKKMVYTTNDGTWNWERL